MNPTLGLKGIVTASIINDGRATGEPVVTKNLWLDQGLNNAAQYPFCQLFAVAAKGTGTTATKEDLTGTANTYSIPNNSTTITRAAGTRDFTTDDVGKLIRFTNGREFHISAFGSTTTATVSPAASPAVTTLKATFYSVEQAGLDAEISRTDTYSSVPGENGTVDDENERTWTRTFIFPSEDIRREVVPTLNTYSQTGTTVTRVNGTRNFSAGDVGKTILFVNSGNTATITTYTNATTVTVGISQSNPEGPIELSKSSGKVESVTGAYVRTGANVTRFSGARDFSPADVGKYIYFRTSLVQAKIISFGNVATVTVDSSGTIASQSINLYGFTEYNEIGFSHTEESGNNINIRVKLASPVTAYVSTPLRASDQLKVAYECKLTVEPDTSTAGNLNTVISDPVNAMSGNKNGDFAIETFATSKVLPSGDTDLGLVDLEPYYEGYAGLALNTDPLEPLSGKIRSNSLFTVPMVGELYQTGSFSRVFTGVFGLNDAVNNNWRSLMISDPDSRLAIFTFLFDVAQKKGGENTFSISFRKTWGRDLS